MYVDITKGCVHDVNVLDSIPIEAGSYYGMDKGYTDFKRLLGLALFEKTPIKVLFSGNINYNSLSDHPALPLWEN